MTVRDHFSPKPSILENPPTHPRPSPGSWGCRTSLNVGTKIEVRNGVGGHQGVRTRTVTLYIERRGDRGGNTDKVKDGKVFNNFRVDDERGKGKRVFSLNTESIRSDNKSIPNPLLRLTHTSHGTRIDLKSIRTTGSDLGKTPPTRREDTLVPGGERRTRKNDDDDGATKTSWSTDLNR